MLGKRQMQRVPLECGSLLRFGPLTLPSVAARCSIRPQRRRVERKTDPTRQHAVVACSEISC